ncbi:MAG TPA: hypothetical protein PLG66_07500, partial [Calditrichia bacterium]|nr:hypothetical protein [Calditrichia bacterium]
GKDQGLRGSRHQIFGNHRLNPVLSTPSFVEQIYVEAQGIATEKYPSILRVLWFLSHGFRLFYY